MNKHGKNHSGKQTLCWDCKNCTNPEVCPWVRDYTPVPGWKAKPNILRDYDSYLVIECPLFKRGAYHGGAEENLLIAKDHITLDYQDMVKLSEAIIGRYVEDWKFLEYGDLDGVRFCGSRLKRDTVVDFFSSEWFADLLACFSDIDPMVILKKLKIVKFLKYKEANE